MIGLNYVIHCLPNTNGKNNVFFIYFEYFRYFLMATVRSHGLFMTFTLSLRDYNYVGGPKTFLDLMFNLQIGSMYVEQDTHNGDGTMWMSRPCLFIIIGLFKSQMQASTIILTN